MRKFQKRRDAVIFLALISLAAFIPTTGGGENSPSDLPVKPAENKALVYFIYPPRWFGSAYRADLQFEDDTSAALRARSYVVKELDPGEHRVDVTPTWGYAEVLSFDRAVSREFAGREKRMISQTDYLNGVPRKVLTSSLLLEQISDNQQRARVYNLVADVGLLDIPEHIKSNPTTDVRIMRYFFPASDKRRIEVTVNAETGKAYYYLVSMNPTAKVTVSSMNSKKAHGVLAEKDMTRVEMFRIIRRDLPNDYFPGESIHLVGTNEYEVIGEHSLRHDVHPFVDYVLASPPAELDRKIERVLYDPSRWTRRPRGF